MIQMKRFIPMGALKNAHANFHGNQKSARGNTVPPVRAKIFSRKLFSGFFQFQHARKTAGSKRPGIEGSKQIGSVGYYCSSFCEKLSGH